MLDNTIVYPIFFFLVASAALLIIPKEKYKKYLIYGALLGGLGDTLVVLLFSKVFPIFRYKNAGVFDVFGLFSIWTPLTWTFVFALALYLLPVRKTYFVPYVLGFVGFSAFTGTVIQQLGLFEYLKPIYSFIDLGIFLVWFLIAVWIYLRTEQIELI